jgi:hypothetical protein
MRWKHIRAKIEHLRPFRAQESSPDMGAPGGKELLAQMRECMTTAKKEY